MQKLITRTVTTTHVYCNALDVIDGQAVVRDLPVFHMEGDVEMKAATKEAKKHYKNIQNVVVTRLEKTSQLLGLDIATFMELAQPITRKGNETEGE